MKPELAVTWKLLVRGGNRRLGRGPVKTCAGLDQTDPGTHKDYVALASSLSREALFSHSHPEHPVSPGSITASLGPAGPSDLGGGGAGRKPRGGELDFSKWDYSSSFRKAGAEFLRTELPSEDSICCSLVLAQAIGQCPETTYSQKSWVLLVYIGDGGHRAILLSNPDSLLAPATA